MIKDEKGNLVRKAYPYEFWVSKTRFIDAVMEGLSGEQMAALNSNPLVTMAIAYLPGNELDILDEKVNTFLALAGMSVDNILEKMGMEFPPDPTKKPEIPDPGIILELDAADGG